VDERPTHLDLFSGIGGFALAAKWAGFRTVGFCEIEPYAQRVLAKNFSAYVADPASYPASYPGGVPIFPDATKFCRRIYDCKYDEESGEAYCPRCDEEFGECGCIGTDQFTDEHGFPDIITCGDPCQAHSNACRAADTIHQSLGAESIRVISELMPRFVIRENPSVVRRDAEWPWQRFCIALEQLGYYTLPIRARACCFGADIKRERMLVLAELPQSERAGLERYEREIVARAERGRQDADLTGPDRWNAAPRICRGADGIPNRVDRLRGLGNAIVPQVAFQILKVIRASC
jgi:DNA (cytosine-5)-methyltransferase 1